MTQDIPQIPEWNGSRLNNGQFRNYAKEVARVAETFPEGPIPITSYVNALKAVNEKLTDFINESRKSAGTADVAAADARRDLIFRALWSYVDLLGRLDGDDEFTKSAHVVQAAFSPYRGAASHPLTKETEEIKGLRLDLEKEEVVLAMIKLGLQPALEALYAANDAVNTAYTQRADARAAQGAIHYGETTASVRKDCVNAVLEIIQTLNALVRLTPSEVIKTATIRMIQVVEQHKTVAAQNGKHPQQPDEGGDTPDEGGEGGADGGSEG